MDEIAGWAEGPGVDALFSTTGLGEELGPASADKIKKLVTSLCKRTNRSGPSSGRAAARARSDEVSALVKSARDHFLIEAIRNDLMGV